MIKSLLFFLAICLHSTIIWAQASLYDYVKLGHYQVGYSDTLLYDENYTYEAFGYNGIKPQFVQIWHPLDKKYSNPNYLTFKDFFERETNADLSEVYKELKQHYREAIIRDCIQENLITGDSNNFGTFSHEDVLSLMYNIESRSILHKNIKHAQYPVIVYHHGAQSTSFENFAMAEYFASRGFIFVSANFHLPYENLSFASKPFNKIIEGEGEQNLKSVSRFAQSLSSSASLYFIGHSWGAQMGLRTFDNDTIIKGFVSLETTIEFKKDFEKIKEMWPEVYKKIITDKAEYPFSILFCASTGKKKRFDIFNNINARQIIFLSTKKEFNHDAYTSTFFLRYFISDKIEQADKEILLDRLLLYSKHLEFINEFIAEINRKEKRPKTVISYLK
jgi:hypothetical protein